MPVFRLSDDLVFPPVHMATPEGLLAVGGDLSPERLLLAYKMGIFPWYSEGEPLLWWSPDPRMVLYPKEIKISRSLKKVLRQERYRLTIDCAFERVINACANVREQVGNGTWITREMIEAYCKLKQMGYGHSVEVWCGAELVGGLYGISLGRSFFGESMYSTMRDASKVALVHLSQLLIQQEFQLIDCQIPSGHLARLGAKELSRDDFMAQHSESLRWPSSLGSWTTMAL